MKKILFMISSLNGGGAQRVTINLANALSEKYDVSLSVTFNGTDAYTPSEKVKVYRISENIEKNQLSKLFAIKKIARFFRVRKLKRTLKPDVTISMLDVQNLFNAICKTGDIRIMSERNDPSRANRYRRWTKNFSYKRADHVVFQTERVKKMFSPKIQKLGKIIFNPVYVSCMKSAESRHVISASGRLVEQKNYPLLIGAFSEFAKTHPEYSLNIYGEGPLETELRDLIHRLGLDEKVFLRGFSNDLHKSISDSEFYVLSSDYEGMSNTLLEAMCMGLPCISTDCAGSDEIIDDGVNGLLTPVGDRAALTAAMCKLADNAALRNSISEACLEKAKQFEIDAIIKEWEKLFN